MKKGESFKMEAAWWRKNKPVTLKPSGLGAALAAYPAAKTAFMGGKRAPGKFEACMKALDTIETTRLKAIQLCGTAHPDTKAALQRDAALNQERAAMLAAKKTTYVSPMRLLKGGLADLLHLVEGTDEKITKFLGDEDTLDPKKAAEARKSYMLLGRDYLPNMITSSASAATTLRNEARILQQYFPDLHQEYTAANGQLDDALRAARALKNRVQEQFPPQN